MTEPTQKPPRALKKLAVAVAATLLTLTILAFTLFLGMGGKMNIITTPSMATYAPVGSLVLTMPAEYDTLQTGDTILFNVAGGETAYFHRIIAVSPNGLSTQGDLNGTIDPWLVTSDDVLGKEVFHASGLGFLLKLLPALVIGVSLLTLLTHYYFPSYWKPLVRIFGGTILASLINYLYHPFVDVAVLSQVVVDGTATTQFVPTGLWSLDAQAVNGTSISNVQPGEIGTVTSSSPNETNQFAVDIHAHTDFWVWVTLFILWVLPVALTIIYLAYARAKGLDLLPEETVEVSEEKETVEASAN